MGRKRQSLSIDGKDRALDNIRIERLWRSLKYEDIYLKRYETMKELKAFCLSMIFSLQKTSKKPSRIFLAEPLKK